MYPFCPLINENELWKLREEVKDDLISIAQVAKELGCSYFVARNKLLRNKECEKLKTKVGHVVVYNKKALEIIRNAESGLPS